MNIGEINITELLLQNRRKHCQEYLQIGRELQELEDKVRAKQDSYNRYTEELKKIDAALKIARDSRRVSRLCSRSPDLVQ